MEKSALPIYRFDEYRVEPARRLLLYQGQPVALTPKAFDTLLYLLKNNERVVAKEELMAALWPDTVVEENNLTQNISTLRRLLKGGDAQYIATVPGSGYRFTAEVGSSTAEDSAMRELAVLPFRPVVAQDRDEALELGMADTLIARLSGVSPGLIVRPLSSVRRYSGPEQDPLAAARSLRVDSVVEGSIQRQERRIRVSVRMLDVRNGASLWAQTFNEDFTDVFAVQDTIADRVTSALALRLQTTGEQRKAALRHPRNVEAYHLYLKGRYHLDRAVLPSLMKSLDFFRQAVDLDPLYAAAYAGLADAYRRLPITSDFSAQDAFPRAKAAVLRALEIDEELAEAHTWLGFLKMWFEWDWAGAEREMERGIALDPQSGYAHMAYQHLLIHTGRDTEALLQGERAIELEPLSLIVNANHGWALFFTGRHKQAVAQLEKTLDLQPAFWVGHLNRGKVHLADAEYDKALTCFQKAKEMSGGNSEPISLIGYTHALADNREEAQHVLDELQARPLHLYTPPISIALLHNGLDDRQQALAWLERAMEERDVRLVFLKRDVKWDNYRDEPRFRRILSRVGLA